MKVSRTWLEAFLRRPMTADDMAARLGMLGAPVDAITATGAALAPFVVGLVTEAVPHPDAEKLRVTRVDDGSGTLHTVVCGAPNVTVGHRYPFARLGTVMPDGLKIEKRKIRGQTSEGMLCSARELGLGADHDGILTLDTDAAPGTPLLQVLPVGDDILELDVTPNRPDLLGHKGVARELATSYGVPFRLPAIPDEAAIDLPTPARHGATASVGEIAVTLEDVSGCPRFLAAVLDGVTVGPSPNWLRERLEAVGVRSINNVVDVTNYVMLELNQPMHAYDAATLRGRALMVRRSTADERLVTLDGVTRALPVGTLVIADGEGPVGVAGVMGGQASEVTAQTTRLLLECAAFEAAGVRRDRRALGLSTDASYRFERGTDRWGAVDAFRRAVRLLITVAGGELVGETVDCFPEPTWPPRIFLRPARVTQVLGFEIAWRDIEKHLVAIGATVVSKPDDERIAVDVPGWRPDITSEIDLIEEIARLHGYDSIPDTLRPFRPGLREDDAAWGAADRVRQAMVAAGLSEAMSLPMVGTTDGAAPEVQQPLSAEHRWLRTALVPGLAAQVEGNWSASIAAVRLFEVGTVFQARPEASPEEALHAAFVVTGPRAPAHWSTGPQATPWDRWDARALFEEMVAVAQPTAQIVATATGWEAQTAKGTCLGWCGPVTADRPAWAAPLWGGEVRVTLASVVGPSYLPLPTYPAIERDLALLLGEGRTVAEVVTLIEQRGRKQSLVAVSVLDEYRGKGLPEGKRSVVFRLVFRAEDRTLTDREIDTAVTKLLTSLARELDVTLRAT